MPAASVKSAGAKNHFMMSVSLDGFFEGPGREFGWQLVDEELHAHFNEWLGVAGAFLDGRITYELMASFCRPPTLTRRALVTFARRRDPNPGRCRRCA
jgi:dihydrofolate reductase